MKKDANDNNSLKTNFKGGSPLSLENLTALKHKDMLKDIPFGKKQLVFEQKETESPLLDESNIK